jgi:hypothetical protein
MTHLPSTTTLAYHGEASYPTRPVSATTTTGSRSEAQLPSCRHTRRRAGCRACIHLMFRNQEDQNTAMRCPAVPPRFHHRESPPHDKGCLRSWFVPCARVAPLMPPLNLKLPKPVHPESENEEESSPTIETLQDSPTQEEPPFPASRPLSLSSVSIDVLGTVLQVRMHRRLCCHLS